MTTEYFPVMNLLTVQWIGPLNFALKTWFHRQGFKQNNCTHAWWRQMWFCSKKKHLQVLSIKTIIGAILFSANLQGLKKWIFKELNDFDLHCVLKWIVGWVNNDVIQVMKVSVFTNMRVNVFSKMLAILLWHVVLHKKLWKLLMFKLPWITRMMSSLSDSKFI